jgi:hypothetical protein
VAWKSYPRWRKWLRLNRLVPSLTILGAGLAIILSLVQVLKLTTSEQIIIALLALLTVDALTERIGVLEKIESKLGNTSGAILRDRSQILTPLQHAQHASEICILVVSGASVILPYAGFYGQRMASGCKIRVVLLNPKCAARATFDLLKQGRASQQMIDSSLEVLRDLVLSTQGKGQCEVRLLDVFLPYSIFAVDPGSTSGSMVVELHSYRVAIDERPHLDLTAADNRHWFAYFSQQFERAWSDAAPWTPEQR